MRTSTRNFLAIGTALGSLAVGIVGARALQSDDAGGATAVAAFDPPMLVSGDAATADDQDYPLLRPVATGDDPRIVEQLIEAPPEVTAETMGPEIGRPGGDTPVIGVVTGSPAPDLSTATPIDGEAPPGGSDDTTGDTASTDEITPLDFPFYFDPAYIGLFPLPELAFDSCAGAEPGTPAPAGCPEGFSGTLRDSRLMPTPFMVGGQGHYLTATEGFPVTCPSDTPAAGAGQTALTIYSVTPLTTLQVQWRPYGSTLEWQSLTVDPATLSEQRDTWLARIAGEAYDRETWGLLPRCVVIDRDPDTAYEVLLTAVDHFGREITANRSFSLPDATPDLRPPTTARIVGQQPLAQVEAWTAPGGSVRLSYVFLTDRNPDATDCTGAGAIDPSLVHTLDGQRAIPVGIYDPTYSRKVVTTIELPPGARALVCATIYDTSNTLRPLGTDVLLLQARTAQRPIVTLEGLRLNDGITIPVGQLWAHIQFPGETTLVDDGCARSWSNDDELRGRVVLRAPLWECEDASLPVDIDGYVKVPVTLSRYVSGPADNTTQSWGIPIQVDNCDPNCSPRPAEYYEIPVPSASLVLCGRSFWESDDGCPQPTDGVAIVKVTYPVIEGARDGFGTATLISSTDRPVVEPTEGEPLLYVVERTAATGADWSDLTATLDVVADRPITISEIILRDALGDAGPGCDGRDLPFTGGAATEFVLELPMCASTALSVTLRYTDAAGASYEQMVAHVFAQLVRSPQIQTTVEFLGGDDAPTYGWMYDFRVALDGQSAGYYDWFNWDGPRGARGGSCMGLDGTTATSHGTPAINVYGSTLEVQVSLNITTGGDTDCSGLGSDGMGPIEFGGSFTLEQLMSGEPLVLTTPPDAPLQMRVTVTPVNPWRLST